MIPLNTGRFNPLSGGWILYLESPTFRLPNQKSLLSSYYLAVADAYMADDQWATAEPGSKVEL
jgi:hypothetical protein